MKKIIATTLGVLLSATAASAFADKQDRENLAQCTQDIKSYYGKSAQTRLRSIKRNGDESRFRLMVNPEGSGNTVVICAVSSDGVLRLENREGVALVNTSSEQTVGQAN